jgi:hypothetical protein
MRYAVALLIAGLLIAATAAFSWWGCTLPERLARQQLRQLKERGELPLELLGVDPEAADLPNFNVRLPDGALALMAVARFLATTWQAWAPAAVVVALGAAALSGRPGRAAAPAPPLRRPSRDGYTAPCGGQCVVAAAVRLGDPRLHGGHLDAARHEQYDAAVGELLDGRGPATALFDPLARPPASPRRPRGRGSPPPGGAHALVRLADGRSHALRVGVNALGRYPQNDLVLAPICVSRRHCVVLVHASGGCEVYDTASRNGTWVNGRRVGRADLLPGDVLTLAGQQLLVAWVGPGGEFLPSASGLETADLEELPSAG